MTGPLIGVAELARLIASDEPPTLLDVRWSLRSPDGRPAFDRGHIPGACYVDLGRDLAAPPRSTGGRHPLPSVERLQECARRWGIGPARTVVAYDDTGGTSAARAWWLLRWAGVTDVFVLDGGLPAWLAAGGPLEDVAILPRPGDLVVRPGCLPTTDAPGLRRFAGAGAILDVRAPERFRGDAEPVDPVAGHIPGSINAPTEGNLATAAGTFLSPAELARRFHGVGVRDDTPVAVYCGSGVTACHTVLALEVAGIGATLYAGSWSDWITDPHRPVGRSG